MREAEELAALLDAGERVEATLTDAVSDLEAAPTRTDDTVTELVDQLERLSERVDAQRARYADTDSGVRCRVCGEPVEGLTYAHLASHGLTVEEYRDEFGECVPL